MAPIPKLRVVQQHARRYLQQERDDDTTTNQRQHRCDRLADGDEQERRRYETYPGPERDMPELLVKLVS